MQQDVDKMSQDLGDGLEQRLLNQLTPILETLNSMTEQLKDNGSAHMGVDTNALERKIQRGFEDVSEALEDVTSTLKTLQSDQSEMRLLLDAVITRMDLIEESTSHSDKDA